MLAQISLVVLVIAVALLVTLDGFRTRTEAPLGHPERPTQDAGPITGPPRAGRIDAFLPPPAATGIPAATRDAGPTQRPESAGPSVARRQPSRTGPLAVRQRPSRRLKDWPVRSRLLLLAGIPTVAVAVVAFCVVRVAGAAEGTSIHSPVGSVRDGAIASVIGFGVAAVVVLALAAWSVTVAARSVLRPLGRLRAGALELPDAVRRIGQSNGQGGPPYVRPVDVDSSDELGEVARAFDQMRRETLRLATNEAAVRGKLNTVFTHLSHRNQSLAERQIRLIDGLGQGEQDAGRLTSLSKMDRIAARMHRGSQNLLVMAGREPSDRWNQPVALANVIRAAVSEIEEQERVSLSGLPDIAVRGPAVNDLVHLLAELTENATSFSSAVMPVDVSSRLLATGGTLIEIADRGIGMAPNELAYANWQLENAQAADADIPGWIGLFVVARLAARHGIRVRLQPAEFGGLTALVWLPDEILTHKGAAGSGRLSDSSTAGSYAGTAASVTETAVGPRFATAQNMAAMVTVPEFAPQRNEVRGAPAGHRPAGDASQQPDPEWSAVGLGPVSRAAYGAASPSGLGPARAEGQAPALGTRDAWNIAGGIAGVGPLPLPGSPATSETEASPTSSTLPGTAAPASQETGSAHDVIMPPAEGRAATGPLPIFDEVESRWFGAGLGLPGRTEAGRRWSSPADEGSRAAQTADWPTSAGSTAAGLPIRTPAANLIPGAIPSTPPSAVPTRSAAEARDRLAGFQRGVTEGRAAADEAASQDADDQVLVLTRQRGSCDQIGRRGGDRLHRRRRP